MSRRRSSDFVASVAWARARWSTRSPAEAWPPPTRQRRATSTTRPGSASRWTCATSARSSTCSTRRAPTSTAPRPGSHALAGHEHVGLPWQTIGSFLRISTHPRIAQHPLSAGAAHGYVDRWLAAPPVWVPPATARTVALYAQLSEVHYVTGNLVPDAQLAAQALELGVAVVSSTRHGPSLRRRMRWPAPT